MQNISNYILNLTSKKLATYLIVYPLILALAHTSLTLVSRLNSFDSEIYNRIVTAIEYGIFILFLFIILFWFLWLRAAAKSVAELKLGLPIKWFHLAFGLFLFYLVFNLSYDFLINFISNINQDYTWIMYAARETINFVGLLVLYPIICHYSARAIYVKKNNAAATFVKSIPFTLLLIFIPISIPFFQNYFSPIKTNQNTLIKIYVLGLGIILLLFMTGLIAAFTGAV
ncbi:hypothetical protein [uncultured Winogradskyella sp.]|uniref:hypothetical protein n=1 Tax=uncultured Winogradskyella sp. TaxID=395353 RepID=UPI002607EF46|nr:hypothetical protein [uncultured Winogradskyella sp.]